MPYDGPEFEICAVCRDEGKASEMLSCRYCERFWCEDCWADVCDGVEVCAAPHCLKRAVRDLERDRAAALEKVGPATVLMARIGPTHTDLLRRAQPQQLRVAELALKALVEDAEERGAA